MRIPFAATLVLLAAVCAGASPQVDFNRDIRPILSRRCWVCHGPDEAKREAELRLDRRESAIGDLGGYAAVVPGDPAASMLLTRVVRDDEDRMPPPETGDHLDEREIALLEAWIRQGAPYDEHWAYVPPRRPEVPGGAPREQAIDAFARARLAEEGLTPAPPADPAALARRLSLDLVGLPPEREGWEAFAADPTPEAFQPMVDRLLASPAYAEHWARLWLDLARYADSMGYAEDTPREIWAYRDWVIRALGSNMPFDRFTVLQLAGDLLPDAGEDELVATAFHRNTLNNTEGGTDDEEFRSAAVVDRVNTTMTVWMGQTMACAQCHSHKYDPISHEDYFRLYAFFDQTEDSDRHDDAPTLPLFAEETEARRLRLEAEIAGLGEQLDALDLTEELAAWLREVEEPPTWTAWTPLAASADGEGVECRIEDDASVLVGGARPAQATYTADLAPEAGMLSAIRLEALPDPSLPAGGPGRSDGGNFVVTGIDVTVVPEVPTPPMGRYVRVELPGNGQLLSLAEVEVDSGGVNIARAGAASQSSTDHGGDASLAIDGNTDGHYFDARSTTHTQTEDDPWWELDLGAVHALSRITVWNRTDGKELWKRLDGFRVQVLDAERGVVWQREGIDAPRQELNLSLDGGRDVAFAAAHADFEQEDFLAANLVHNPDPRERGWAISPRAGQLHEVVLVARAPAEIPVGATVRVTIEHRSRWDGHAVGRFRLSATPARRELVDLPHAVRAALVIPAGERDEAAQGTLAAHHRSISPGAQEIERERARLAAELESLRPYTRVPIMRELPPGERRETRIHLRGNFLAPGDRVEPGVPPAYHPFPAGAPRNRLGLAQWLVARDNPLTARVTVNRLWEQLFGVGLVRTSEDFGTQGELPSHPELLDWLAVELMDSGWDLQAMLRLMVGSRTYQQSSRVTPEAYERDPDNRLLARGPRVRIAAETVRDQALAVAGLLSDKRFGPPARPPRPKLGLNAAFAGSTDWEDSTGEDRYRRAVYTSWRRSIPYPSMATFDATSRQICTVRRSRTNTPLQALVLQNDPVYVEAAQALARRIVAAADGDSARVDLAVRLCLCRPPAEREAATLLALLRRAREQFASAPGRAAEMATVPLGSAPDGADVAELAAWTVVGSVLLNTDEMILPP